jgi:aspartyl-tRNA(Asn)/glutamyl-tRNA(Gln) amidotransferase subunit B
MFINGKEPAEIIKEKGLIQISDAGEIAAVVNQVLAANQTVIEDYKAGKEKAFSYLVGQVMKETKGKANPALVNRLLKEHLG